MSGEFMRRLASIFNRQDIEQGLEEEMQFHIEQQTRKNIALGMEPAAARRAAEQRFGGVDRMKEQTRDEFRPALVEDGLRDLRYGIRTLTRAPGFAIVGILTLALGIGAATAVFSVVNGVLLRPLPYPQPDRIVRLFEVNKDNHPTAVAHTNFVDWESMSHTFAAMAEYAHASDVSVLSGADARRAGVTVVSRGFFDVMAVHPLHGRSFSPEDQNTGATPVAIVSDKYWREALGGRNIAGQTLRFEQRVYQVAGVMPPGFDYPQRTSIWTPSELDTPPVSRTAHNFAAIARLRDGATVEAAQADLSASSKKMKAQYGDDTWMVDASVVPLQTYLTKDAEPVLFVLFGAGAFLLLIACANVSSLLLARAATRRRELSVRLALGAGRIAVLRQLMAESFILCVAGGALGVLFASLGLHALLARDPGALPRVQEISVDRAALFFAFAVSVITAVILGFATAARTGQQDLRSLISNDGRTLTGGVGSQRIRDALVVAQVAMTIILLMAAGLLARSFVRVLRVEPGFSTENALILDAALAGISDDPTSTQRQIAFQEALIQRLGALPGVKNVGIVSDFPMGGSYYADGQFLEMTSPTEIQSYDDFAKLSQADIKQRSANAGFRIASDGYFAAMGIPLISGRMFNAGDAPDAPEVALISESLAKTKWPGRDPIGRYIQFGNMDGDMRALRIIGVVGDVREFGPEQLPQPVLYANYRQRPVKMSRFSAIARGPDPSTIMRSAQQIVRDLDPQLPVVTRTMQDAIDATFSGRRFSLMVVGVFSAVALVLSTLGLYGVISYLVAQRRREIGIRTVLGASSRSVMRLVVSKAARLAIYGMVLGSIGALAFARVLEGLLFGGVTTTDPAALASVVAIIAGAVFAATAVPVRKALHVSPMMALRDD
jgi:predicted permease